MQKRLSEKLKDKNSFVVVAELTGGPGFNFAPIEKFLKAYKTTGKSAIPAGFDFVAITSPQNPGGTANIEPANVLGKMKLDNLLDELDFVPHITCKDQNADAIVSSLVGFREMGIDSLLALTGDKPAKAKGVFELDSVGLLQVIRDMNNESYLKAQPDMLNNAHQFFAGAAISPFKYTEPSLMQQYYKMEKKIACGAKFFITQVGWDWKKSLELFRYLKDNNLDVPVIGNVYLLSTITPAARLMHDGKLTGCFVSDDLLEKVHSESIDEHIERAAQQVAMYKAFGAAGVDIGGAHNFETFIRILNRAAEIGSDWGQYKNNLCWPPRKAFYLYDEAGRKTDLSTYPQKFKHRIFNFFHRAVLDPRYRGFQV